MNSYTVKEKMPDHSWLTTKGTFEVTNEALGNRISRLLEADGCEVSKQDNSADTPEGT